MSYTPPCTGINSIADSTEKIKKFSLIKEGLSKHFTEKALWNVEFFISDKITKIINDRDEDWCFPIESYEDYKNPGNILCDLGKVKFMVSIDKDNLKINTHLRDWDNCKVQNIKCGYFDKDKQFDSKEDVFVELIKIFDFYNEEQPYENDGSEEWMNLDNDRKRMFSKYSIVDEDRKDIKEIVLKNVEKLMKQSDNIQNDNSLEEHEKLVELKKIKEKLVELKNNYEEELDEEELDEEENLYIKEEFDEEEREIMMELERSKKERLKIDEEEEKELKRRKEERLFLENEIFSRRMDYLTKRRQESCKVYIG